MTVTAEQAWGDKRLTTVGLLFESTTGLGRIFEPQLSADSGLSRQSFDVLVRLARTPGYRLRMSELASQTSLTPSGLTRSVDRLEESGMVSRESCPDDRRGAFAVLSERGRAVMDDAIPLHIAHIDEVLDGVLTPSEERTLSSLLRKIRDHVHTVEQPGGPGD
jgi:MarR family 2-MHQ and catechol resistance regulon transcriptional repressor